MAIEAVDGLKFWAGDPRNLIMDTNKAINWLIKRSVVADFPLRSPEQIDYLMAEVNRQKRHPNRGIGSSLLRRRQSFSHPYAVVAYKDLAPVAFLLTADNASSQKPWPLGAVERQAKHRLEQVGDHDFISHRWHWLGLRAISSELAAPSDEIGPDNLQTIDVMHALALEKRDSRQPISSYPWRGERNWAETLESFGLEYDGKPVEPIYAFGEAAPVEQARYTLTARGLIGGVARAREIYMAKPDAEEALDYAMSSIRA